MQEQVSCNVRVRVSIPIVAIYMHASLPFHVFLAPFVSCPLDGVGTFVVHIATCTVYTDTYSLTNNAIDSFISQLQEKGQCLSEAK